MLLNSVFVVAAAAQSVSVLTYHNDSQRTGLNPLETKLNPTNVNSNSFGKVGFLPADGGVVAEPLYVSDVVIGSQKHNVVYMATEHDSVYAYDAENGMLLWRSSALMPGEVPPAFHNCPLLLPENGITATPVIDLTRGPKGAIYFVATSQLGMNIHHRLHALDLASGAELFGGPVDIEGKYPGTGDNSHNGFVIFDPNQYFARAALLESNGKVYVGFSSQCDQRPYTGWLMQYDASTLDQLSVLDVTPNGSQGGIWQAGGGLAGDTQGNVYVMDGNGTFDTTLDANGFPLFGDFGNAFLKVSGSTPMSVVDYFATYDTVQESNEDGDLGSGAPMVFDPPSGSGLGKFHLVVGTGKDGNIYIANRDNMGKWNPDNNNQLYQEMHKALPTGSFATPAFFHNTMYYGALNAPMKAFPFTLGRLQPLSSKTAVTFPYPGTTPSVSSYLGINGIVWAVANVNIKKPGGATLYAYDALDLTKKLYDSTEQANRDNLGTARKFVIPMVANGKVYVGGWSGVSVFGLLQ